MHGNAMSTSLHAETGGLNNIRITGITLVAKGRYVVNVDMQPHDESLSNKPTQRTRLTAKPGKQAKRDVYYKPGQQGLSASKDRGGPRAPLLETRALQTPSLLQTRLHEE